jgi:hypothetical protein
VTISTYCVTEWYDAVNEAWRFALRILKYGCNWRCILFVGGISNDEVDDIPLISAEYWWRLYSLFCNINFQHLMRRVTYTVRSKSWRYWCKLVWKIGNQFCCYLKRPCQPYGRRSHVGSNPNKSLGQNHISHLVSNGFFRHSLLLVTWNTQIATCWLMLISLFV